MRIALVVLLVLVCAARRDWRRTSDSKIDAMIEFEDQEDLKDQLRGMGAPESFVQGLDDPDMPFGVVEVAYAELDSKYVRDHEQREKLKFKWEQIFKLGGLSVTVNTMSDDNRITIVAERGIVDMTKVKDFCEAQKHVENFVWATRDEL